MMLKISPLQMQSLEEQSLATFMARLDRDLRETRPDFAAEEAERRSEFIRSSVQFARSIELNSEHDVAAYVFLAYDFGPHLERTGLKDVRDILAAKDAAWRDSRMSMIVALVEMNRA